MKFVGSKNRLAKHLKPIIESYITDDTEAYIEPFVGGANMIDKIDFHNKIGYDIHKYLISLLNYISNGGEMPDTVSEDEYNHVKDNKDNYDDWYVGLVGFACTWGSKWFGGYARATKKDGTLRDMQNEGIRNLRRQKDDLQGIKFINSSFKDINISKINNSVIYCDIPYKGTTKYKHTNFDYDYFYKWCKELKKNNNIVLISEYDMPDNFELVWEKEHRTNIDLKKYRKTIEKLFKA